MDPFASLLIAALEAPELCTIPHIRQQCSALGRRTVLVGCVITPVNMGHTPTRYLQHSCL
jgi:hypothetical protein